MIYFYFAKMRKGNQKIRGRASTMTMLKEWIEYQIKQGYTLVEIETV